MSIAFPPVTSWVVEEVTEEEDVMSFALDFAFTCAFAFSFACACARGIDVCQSP
jgi:hypothetical protein